MQIVNHTLRFWALALLTAFLVACCARKADAKPRRLNVPKSAINGRSLSSPAKLPEQVCYRRPLDQGTGSVLICVPRGKK